MSSPLKISQEEAQDISMVDIAFELLQSTNKPYHYRELLQEIAKIKGMSEQEMMDVIAQLYTEINIDGRFVCVGQSLWGLKRWYPVEQQEDAAEGVMARDDDDYDDLDEIIDEDEDFDDFDDEDEDDSEDEDEDEEDDDDEDDDDDDGDFDDTDDDLVDDFGDDTVIAEDFEESDEFEDEAADLDEASDEEEDF